MTLFQTFRALPQKTRITIGATFLAWGAIGLYISDTAEKKFGLEATQKDKEALKEAVLPKITIVERDGVEAGKKGG